MAFMEFFDKVSKTVTEKSKDVVAKAKETGKDVASKAKEMSEIVRLNGQVTTEEENLRAQYQAIGKAYYESHKDDEAFVFADNFCAIEESLAKIAQYKEELQALKGITVCPNCKAELKAGTLFCSTCGAKQPEPPVEEVVVDEACECEEKAEESCECCCEEKTEEPCECCCEEKMEEPCECCCEEKTEEPCECCCEEKTEEPCECTCEESVEKAE